MRRTVLILASLATLLVFPASAADSPHPSTYCARYQRDAHGRIKRRTSVRSQFQREHPALQQACKAAHAPATSKTTSAR